MVTEIKVRFPTKDVINIKYGLVEKYGKPTKTSSDRYQNGFGAVFDSENAQWIFKEGYIFMNERTESKDIGEVHIISKQHYKFKQDVQQLKNNVLPGF